MGQCAAKTNSGNSCQISTAPGQKYCHVHRRNRFVLSASLAVVGTLILTIIGVAADITGLLDYIGISPIEEQQPTIIEEQQPTTNELIVSGDISDSTIVQSEGGDIEINQASVQPEIIANEQILNCMERHHMPSATYQSVNDTQENPKLFRKHLLQFCNWPPPTYAAPDGYSEIQVETYLTVDAEPPRSDQVAPIADRIISTCDIVELGYSFGIQGIHGFHDKIHIPTNTFEHLSNILNAGKYNEIQKDRYGNSIFTGFFIGFYPKRNEIVLLHNDYDFFDSAECVK